MGYRTKQADRVLPYRPSPASSANGSSHGSPGAALSPRHLAMHGVEDLQVTTERSVIRRYSRGGIIAALIGGQAEFRRRCGSWASRALGLGINIVGLPPAPPPGGAHCLPTADAGHDAKGQHTAL